VGLDHPSTGGPALIARPALPAAEAAAPARPWAGAARSAADYLSLTKPRIMVLLLITEMSAVVAASRGRVEPSVVLAALAGGALCAGGAAAVNCWYDRDIDAVMPRTCQRPIAAGRVSPRRGLIFAGLLSAAGVTVLALGTNVLAALLALAGGLFYAVVYTMWLKRSTTQNIVIGGAAGAVPPLVGWAIAVHGLAPLALVLFGVVLLWTPPHFWALALLLRRQYALAGVPMLPTVRGETVTRISIAVYSVLLFLVSLLPGVWLGAGYLVAAGGLGVLLLGLAGAAVLDHGRSAAALLFHYSILYLGLLFVAVAVTAVLG
jgi:protoheme IX farnesyltransferase